MGTEIEDRYVVRKADTESKGEYLLSDEQVIKIATAINKKVNLPFLNEKEEFTVAVKMVRAIDRFLYKVLPNEIYSLINDLAHGMTKEAAEKLKAELKKIIKKYVDFPFIPNELEAIIFGLVIDLIVDALVKEKVL